MADIKETLSAAGDGAVHVADGFGEYVYCYDLNGLVKVELWWDNQLKETHIVERFTTLPNKSFDRLVIENISGVENEIRFFTGKGQYIPSQDRANVVVDAGTAGALPVSIGHTLEVAFDASQVALTVNSFDVAYGSTELDDIEVPAGQKVTLFPADNERVEAIIQSRDDNIGSVRIAPHGNASAVSGEILKPEGSASYRTVTAITAYNEGGASVWLARNELTRGGL